jgi:hypothetical protein
MTFKKWREKGESLRVDRYRSRCIDSPAEGRSGCLCQIMIMSAKTKVTKTKTALKQETSRYNLSDLPVKHDPHCGFKFVELVTVELGGGLAGGGLGLLVTNTIGSNNSKLAKY